jgi:hypothetical protein
MTEKAEFKTWAIVEVMGHVEYAGLVTSETIAGSAMLRIDVPEMKDRAAFTKYLATGALYGITPCSEATARARADRIRAVPFQTFDIENQFLKSLKESGRLIESNPAVFDDDENPF